MKRQFLFLGLLTVIAGLLGGAISNHIFTAQAANAQQQTESHIVRDRDGSNRVTLGMLPAKIFGEESPGLILFGKQNTSYFALGLTDDGTVIRFPGGTKVTWQPPLGQITTQIDLDAINARLDDLENRVSVLEQDDVVYVYITRTGKRYHRASCRWGYTKVTLEEAKERGFTPCKVCKPPR